MKLEAEQILFDVSRQRTEEFLGLPTQEVVTLPLSALAYFTRHIAFGEHLFRRGILLAGTQSCDKETGRAQAYGEFLKLGNDPKLPIRWRILALLSLVRVLDRVGDLEAVGNLLEDWQRMASRYRIRDMYLLGRYHLSGLGCAAESVTLIVCASN
jgi:hypothetical protein